MSVTEVPEVDEVDPNALRGSSPARELWRRFRRQKIAMAGLVFILLLVLVAIFAPLVAPYDPDEIHQAVPPGGTAPIALDNEPPSSEFWLGTDDVGRDVLSRVIFGARVSLRAGFQIVGMALLVALPLGLLAGYLGGRTDAVLMRVMDALFAFPPLILALSVAALLGPSLTNTMIAVSIVFIPGFARLIRGQVLAVREETYIEASRSIGAGTPRIMVRHVLPNVASPLIVQVALSFGFAILTEAGLSFLGLGAQPPTATWGTMLSRAFNAILQSQWPLFPPGLAILLTVLAFNLVGDGLRDALGREALKVRA